MQSDAQYLTPEIPRARYRELLRETMETATEVTARLTWQKFRWRLRHLTWRSAVRNACRLAGIGARS